MAKKPVSVPSDNPGMRLVMSYAAIFVVDAVVIYLANMFFPRFVVLGTMSITPLWAILHSAGVLALIGTFAIPFMREIEKMKGRMLTSQEWMIKYFVLNVVALWIVARFSDQFGMGLSGWYVAVVLAAVLDFLQGVIMMQMQKMMPTQS